MAEDKAQVPVGVYETKSGKQEKEYFITSPHRQVILSMRKEKAGWRAGTLITQKYSRHQRGETTALYSEVRNILQKIANHQGKSIQYTMETQTEGMVRFFRRYAGKTMFPWDQNIDELPAGGLKLTATIRPSMNPLARLMHRMGLKK